MALNFPGPYGLRIFYTSTPATFPTLTHKTEFNINVSGSPTPGTAFEDINIARRVDAAISADAAVDALVALLAPFYSTGTDFLTAEIWEYAPDSFDATFISVYAINTPGTGGAPSAAHAASQTILTFRSMNGGIAKTALMESTIGAGQKQGFPSSNTGINALANYIAAPNTWFLARDNGWLVAPLNLLPGQSEALFKRRFRA